MSPAAHAAAWAGALLDPQAPCPPGLCSWNGSEVAQRFAVHRNNVLAGLVDALAETYPVVQQLVGEPFFRALAAAHVRARPPRSPVLARYGGDLASFIEGFEPAAALPWLPDVARLEWARVEACHAADAAPLGPAALAAALTDPAALATARLGLHPSVRLLRSRHAAVSIWAAHQPGGPDLSTVETRQAECALVLRPALQVTVLQVDAATATLAAALRAGLPLASALATCPDPGAALGVLLRHQALGAFQAPSEDLP